MKALRDAVLPALLAVCMWIEIAGFWVPAEQGSRAAALVLGTGMCAALTVRRRAPLATAAAVAGLLAVWCLLEPPRGALVPWLASLLAVYAAAQECPRTPALLGGALVLAANWLIAYTGTNDFADYVFVTVFAAGAWAAGRAVRRRQLQSARLADERDSRAAAAVREERQRIARELHDVVAHSMGVIVVQAQAAAGMLRDNDDAAPAREAVESIERTGREALGEMRRMLGLIRERADGPVGPLPSLRRVEPLIADVRAAGLPVSVEIRGTERPLPAGVDASAYRILQEGLTNVRKHAGAAHAEVVIAYRADRVELSVCDDGHSAGRPRADGHGLLGIGERVAVFDGTVEAGPRPEGGWRIRATLPVAE